MLKNYIKIAWRNLKKHKLFSFINILGLGIAIPFALLALIQLQGSFEFDNFHKDSDRIVRVITDKITKEGIKTSFASSPYNLENKLSEEFSCVENSTKVVREFGWVLSNKLKTRDINAIYTEPEFFEIFNFPLEKGAYSTDPNTMVLSHEAAEWYFNDTNPIGKSLEHPDKGAIRITGVLKEHKPRTQFKADAMVSISTYENADKSETEKWSDLQSHTYLKLVPGYDLKKIDHVLDNLSEAVSGSFLANSDHRLRFKAQEFDQISPARTRLEFNPYVEDLNDIYFNFSIPLLILLLASFNYVNLTLARSLSRSKEVGVRKVMGALRTQLVGQFLSEAVIISFLSLSLGLFLLWLAKNNLHVSWIHWEVDHVEFVIISFIIFTFLLGLIAGLMPATILSGFQPVKVLKGNISPSTFGKVGFRRALIVIQFTVTLGFIFMMGHMYNQFNYMATENENFNRKGIYNLSLKGKGESSVIHEISNLKEVKQVGRVSQLFGNMPARIGIASEPKAERTLSYYYAADREFIQNMGLSFVAGENIPTSESDSSLSLIVLNEKAVERLHLGSSQEAIGKQVFFESDKPLTVVGVVQNFCHFNYQFEIEPLVLQYNPNQFHIASILTEESINHEFFESEIERIWHLENPYLEAEGSWLATDLYERYYPAEDMKLFGITGVIIFIIALMGLLGMLVYSAEKRVKEIGIRKVMGAEVSQIIKMMAWSFLKLLLIATVVAVPFGVVSGMFINVKLFTFNNGVNYGLMFLFAMVVLAVAGAAVGLFSFRSASINPVESLKNE